MARDTIGSSLNRKTSHKKRTSCPKSVKEAVWRDYFGNRMTGKCYACRKRINFTDFEVGHNKAASKGGSWNLQNLRPICRTCNRSMGTMAIETFKKKYFGGTPTRKARKTKIGRKDLDLKQTKNEKLKIYSPIHAMIVKVNGKIPRKVALRLTVGSWVNGSLMNFDGISALFNQHCDKFRDKDLEMWFKIEKELKEKGGFYMGRTEQEWFDELEAEYNRLKN